MSTKKTDKRKPTTQKSKDENDKKQKLKEDPPKALNSKLMTRPLGPFPKVQAATSVIPPIPRPIPAALPRPVIASYVEPVACASCKSIECPTLAVPPTPRCPNTSDRHNLARSTTEVPLTAVTLAEIQVCSCTNTTIAFFSFRLMFFFFFFSAEWTFAGLCYFLYVEALDRP